MYIEPRGRPRPWTPEDEAELRILWGSGVRLGMIAAALRRTSEACGRRARLLKIPRDRVIRRTTAQVAGRAQPKADDPL